MLFLVWWGEKETGHASLIIFSKTMPFSDCYVTRWPLNRRKLQFAISLLGNPNGDRVRLMEVTVE